MYKPNISGFADFCSHHADRSPIYFVNGKLYANFNMLVMIECKYNFLFPESKRETEKAIVENMYMFDIEETNRFYYPNDNMFSSDNSIRGIKGQILTLERKYIQKGVLLNV